MSHTVKSFGPFEMAAMSGGEAISFLSVPLKDKYSQVILSVRDNSQQAFVSPADIFIVGAEVVIQGSVQGYNTTLSRTFLRSHWGAQIYRLDGSELYDQLVFKGRLFCAGKPGIPTDAVLSTTVALSCAVTVNFVSGG